MNNLNPWDLYGTPSDINFFGFPVKHIEEEYEDWGDYTSILGRNYDIKKILRVVKKTRDLWLVKLAPLESLYLTCLEDVSEEFVDVSDLRRPIVIAWNTLSVKLEVKNSMGKGPFLKVIDPPINVEERQMVLLDGFCRLKKALKLGMDMLPCYVISWRDLRECEID